MITPSTRTTRYEIAVLPESDINYRHYAIQVEYRGDQRWAVLHFGSCLGADGEWDYEPSSTSREDDWLDTHRFPLERALQLAEQAAPDIEVNSITARDILARIAARDTSTDHQPR